MQSCNDRSRRLAVIVIVVEQLRGETDGRIREPVQGLGRDPIICNRPA